MRSCRRNRRPLVAGSLDYWYGKLQVAGGGHARYPRTLSQKTQAEAGMMLDSHVKKGDMLTLMTAHVSG